MPATISQHDVCVIPVPSPANHYHAS